DTSKAKTSWRVATTWQGQARSRAEVTGFRIGGEDVARRFTFDIDEPYELGGSNRFANPQEHLIAALNACMTVGYVAQCAVRGRRHLGRRGRPRLANGLGANLEPEHLTKGPAPPGRRPERGLHAYLYGSPRHARHDRRKHRRGAPQRPGNPGQIRGQVHDLLV